MKKFNERNNKRRGNCSIIFWQGKWLIAAREGFVPGRIILADLDMNTMSASTIRSLKIPIELGASSGVVDPRLFIFQDKLFCSYTYEIDWHTETFQCLAEINRDGVVLSNRIFPRLHHPYEKNWQFFEHQGELLIEYSVSPEHVVLDLDLNVRARLSGFSWQYGDARCSVPPVLHDGCYIALCHSYLPLECQWDDRRYSVGFYTFEARAPFKIINYPTSFLLSPRATDKPVNYPSC